MICFKFYRQSCARTELKTVKDNPPSQHLTGNPLTFDRRLCPGARLGNLNLCLAGVGNLNRSVKQRFSRRVESHGRRFCLLRKSWVGHFNNFFPLGGGEGVERYEKTNHQKRECPKVCPGEDVEDGQLKTGEQLRFACLYTRLRARLDHEVREYCTRTSPV